MYTNNEYRTHVNIPLNNGIYIFDDETATGKTRLCKYLKKLRAYGEPVNSLTYNDILSGTTIESIFEPNIKLVMLDRYDMYNNRGHEIIKKMKDSCIILIDCKKSFKVTDDYEDCFMHMTSSSLEVTT